MIFVTGGAGFIGSNFILEWLRLGGESVVNLDSLTYAGNIENFASIAGHPQYLFSHTDIGDAAAIRRLLCQHRPRAVIHFAAESHVDRSIEGPAEFIRTNIDGTFTLLEVVREWWGELATAERHAFRFVHVSTDEVYGSLDPTDPPFSETTPYRPNSPYSASKAASDHLVRAYHHTYGLPTITTNCSNNYGPYQFPEKLIPLMIANALDGKPLPIYGDGLNIRDWLYVGDHCAALRRILEAGMVGQTYNIGGRAERTNVEIVNTICALLDRLSPSPVGSYARLKTFVADRLGHDRRYAVDTRKIATELGWAPTETFDSGIEKTVRWYLANRKWVRNVQSGAYRTQTGEQAAAAVS